jgi:hypothetical protein
MPGRHCTLYTSCKIASFYRRRNKTTNSYLNGQEGIWAQLSPPPVPWNIPTEFGKLDQKSQSHWLCHLHPHPFLSKGTTDVIWYASSSGRTNANPEVGILYERVEGSTGHIPQSYSGWYLGSRERHSPVRWAFPHLRVWPPTLIGQPLWRA